MRIIANRFQVTVALLEYRLTPEYRFPTGHRDAYDGLKWVSLLGSASKGSANFDN